MTQNVDVLLRELDDLNEILEDLKQNTSGESIEAETYKVLVEIYSKKKHAILSVLNVVEEKIEIQEAVKKTKESVYVTFGRFNPVTKGHEEMIQYMVDKARTDGADVFVFTSPIQDNKKNPLDFKTKVKYLTKFFPDVNIYDKSDVRSMFDVLYRLKEMGYTDVHLFVGEDREAELAKSVRKYINHSDPEKNLPFANFQLPKTPPRTKGVSGTQMRKYVVDDDLEGFQQNLPSKSTTADAKALFNAVRAGLSATKKKQ